MFRNTCQKRSIELHTLLRRCPPLGDARLSRVNMESAMLWLGIQYTLSSKQRAVVLCHIKWHTRLNTQLKVDVINIYSNGQLYDTRPRLSMAEGCCKCQEERCVDFTPTILPQSGHTGGIESTKIGYSMPPYDTMPFRSTTASV